MGIIFIFVFVPVYIVLCLIVLVLGRNIKNEEESRFIFIGIAVGIIFTLFSIYLLSSVKYREYEGMFYLTATTLFAPIILYIVLCLFIGGSSKSSTNNLLAGVLFSVILTPWTTLYAGITYEKNISYFLFPGVCDDAEIKILKNVSGVKNLAFLSDSFAIYDNNQGVKYKPQASYLLSKSLLEHVEVPIKNSREFQQLRTIGKRTPKIMYDSGNYQNIESKPIDSLAAEYVVSSNLLKLPKARKWKIYGSRIEIKRTVDDELIAYAQYYWDKSKNKMCPEEAIDNLFIYRFITESLNVNHPDNKL